MCAFQLEFSHSSLWVPWSMCTLNPKSLYTATDWKLSDEVTVNLNVLSKFLMIDRVGVGTGGGGGSR